MSAFCHATEAGPRPERKKGEKWGNENCLTDTQRQGKTIKANSFIEGEEGES